MLKYPSIQQVFKILGLISSSGGKTADRLWMARYWAVQILLQNQHIPKHPTNHSVQYFKFNNQVWKTTP